jgi:hypothetical protein
MSAKSIPPVTNNANTIARFMSFSSAPEIYAWLSWPTGNIYPAASECNVGALFNLQNTLVGDPFSSRSEKQIG